MSRAFTPSPIPLAAAPFIAAFWFSYLAWFGMEMWIFARDRQAVTGQVADRGSRRFLIAALYLGLGSAFLVAYGVGATRIRVWSMALAWGGLAAMWAGMLLRGWAVVTLGRFFRTRVVVQDDHQLVTGGPYARLRNPGYTGAMLTLIGLGLALGNWLSLAILLGCGLAGYGWRIRVEERAMAEAFGERYAAFRKGRWALVPLLW